MFKIKPYGKIFANEDSSLNEDWTLGGQFDNTNPIYKDLEKNKWVKVQGWEGPEKAAEMIGAAIARAANS